MLECWQSLNHLPDSNAVHPRHPLRPDARLAASVALGWHAHQPEVEPPWIIVEQALRDGDISTIRSYRTHEEGRADHQTRSRLEWQTIYQVNVRWDALKGGLAQLSPTARSTASGSQRIPRPRRRAAGGAASAGLAASGGRQWRPWAQVLSTRTGARRALHRSTPASTSPVAPVGGAVR